MSKVLITFKTIYSSPAYICALLPVLISLCQQPRASPVPQRDVTMGRRELSAPLCRSSGGSGMAPVPQHSPLASLHCRRSCRNADSSCSLTFSTARFCHRVLREAGMGGASAPPALGAGCVPQAAPAAHGSSAGGTAQSRLWLRAVV